MRTQLFVLNFFAIVTCVGLTKNSFASPIDYSVRALSDPKTKVIYYLESDRRHIAAMTLEGKLLWCSEIVPLPRKDWKGIKPESIQAFWLMSPDDKSRGDGHGDDYLKVSIIGEGFGGMQGYVDKKTGKFILGEVS